MLWIRKSPYILHEFFYLFIYFLEIMDVYYTQIITIFKKSSWNTSSLNCFFSSNENRKGYLPLNCSSFSVEKKIDSFKNFVIYFYKIFFKGLNWIKILNTWGLHSILSPEEEKKVAQNFLIYFCAEKKLQTFLLKWLVCPVRWGCRIHRLLLCRRVKTPAPQTYVLDMTLNNLMVRFQ